jgi:hypothetical protein
MTRKWNIRASDRYSFSLNKYDTRPKIAMKPPKVAHTILKSTVAKVGISDQDPFCNTSVRSKMSAIEPVCSADTKMIRI